MSKKRKIYRKSKKVHSTYKGLPLVDAVEDLEVCITKKDVSTARAKDPNRCAAANALHRTLKTDAEVHISRTYIKDEENQRWVRFLTPSSVSREITSFDRANIFEPGTYNLKAPSVGQRLGLSRAKSHKETGTGKKKKPAQHVTANVRESAK